jgi:hypothetical protein
MSKIVGRRPIEIKISSQLDGYVPVFNSTTRLWDVVNKSDLTSGSATTSGSNTFIGSQTISGSLTVTQGITSSLLGTASFASNAWNVGGNNFGIVGGPERIFGTLSDHDISIYASGSKIATFTRSGSLVIGNSLPDNVAQERLLIDSQNSTSYNLIKGKGTTNNYLQFNLQNSSTATSASSDVVATADNGSESTYYVNMGINGSGYVNNGNGVGDANDAYLYSTGTDLHIGNASNFPVQFFAGGLDNNANRKFQLSPNNLHNMTGSLDVSGSVVARSFTGSLQGTASYAPTASYANNFTVAGTLTAQTIVAQTITSSIEFITGSTRNGSLLSNTHQFTGSVSVTGSLAVNGSNVVLTNQTSSMSVASASVSAVAIYVNGGIFTGSNIVTSGSYAISATSASFSSTASYWSGSVLNATSASYALSASYWSGSVINAATASYAVNAQTASYVVQAQSASYWSGSVINAATASYVITAQTASYAANAQTASYIQNAQTASYVLNAVSSSFTATASSADNFLVRGTLTAQTIVAQTITSSIEFVTGSTKNGSLLSNTHQFTGSVLITGSLNVNGSDAILTNQTSSMSVASASISAVAIYVNGGIFTGSNIVTSASYAVTATSASNALTASYWSGSISNATSASYAVSSSYATQALTASYAATSSYADNFIVGNTLTAQRIVVQTISSSISYSSGSNRFGSLLTDTHQFTGSVLITGSLTVAGNILPSADSIYTLGASGTRFSNIYSANGVISALYTTTIRAATNTILFGANQTNYWGGFIGNSPSSSANLILTYTSSAGLTDNGYKLQVYSTGSVSGSLFVSSSGVAATLIGSGSNVFSVDGTSGRLFSVDDSLSGSLFSVNTAAGLPVIEAFSDNTVRIGQFGQKALFVSSSRVGIGKETPLTANLDISGSAAITGSLTVTAGITGSLSGSATNAVSASFAATASSADNFTVRGTLTAQTIVAQTITSSTDFVTGSSRFGSLLANTHQFTGSVSITGSLAVNGSPAILTNQTSSMSVATASYVLQAVSASFASFTPGISNGTASNAATASYVVTAQTASYVLNAISASYAATASSADNFTVRGTLTAQTINVQTITSSIEFNTGSTRNGSLLSNTHEFTGSVLMTGSLQVNGTTAILGTGTINTVPKFTTANIIGNSNITDSGTLVTLGSNTSVNGLLGIGVTPTVGYSIFVSRNITGNAVTSYGIANTGTVLSDVTNTVYGIINQSNTQATSFTLSNYIHYGTSQGNIGAGSAITNQSGFVVGSDLVGATNNYGFRGNIPSGANNWNLFMSGTAKNYLAGNTSIGSVTDAGFRLDVSGSTRLNGAVTVASASIQSQNTSSLASGT